MANTDKAFYVVTVGGGKCLDNTQSAHGVLDCLPTESQSQKWFIEADPDNANVVAFKSAVDGKYLRNEMPHVISGARIGMGEKQWWTLEKGRNPGSCLIKSNACTIGGSYLNDFEGVYRDRNLVHMWQYVAHLQFWLDWYFLPTDATFHPNAMVASKSATASSGGDQAQKVKDLEAKQRELEKKEKSLADREAALEKQATKRPAATLAQKTDDTAAKEAALRKREQEVAAREADLKKQAASQSTEGLGDQASDQAREAALKKREQNMAQQEEELKQRLAGLDSQPQSNGTISGGDDNSQLEILKAENENLKLKLRIQDLEEQLKNANKPPSKAKPARGANHASNSALGKKDPVIYECGHVAYPPPRKLRRHIVGMLYEGLDQPFELSERQKATLAKHEHHQH